MRAKNEAAARNKDRREHYEKQITFYLRCNVKACHIFKSIATKNYAKTLKIWFQA